MPRLDSAWTTGARSLWLRFAPADKNGIQSGNYLVITPDGEHFGYTVRRVSSNLFVTDGLR